MLSNKGSLCHGQTRIVGLAGSGIEVIAWFIIGRNDMMSLEKECFNIS